MAAKVWWAGRDLNPRTPPCQGGILTKLDHRPSLKLIAPKIHESFFSAILY
jgi:hypothetical protein